MPQPRRRASINVLPNYIAPMDCPRCGAYAHLIDCVPLPAGLSGEMQTFECKDCGKQTKIIVKDLSRP
jgi:transcription elongation factor Elf1